MKSKSNRKYGWKPDLPDPRDHVLALAAPAAALPASVDLRELCPPVYDQGDMGSCTANAISAAIEFDQRRQNSARFQPSRLFIYYNERAIERTADYDSGATLRDGMRSVNQEGACPETLWPYLPEKLLEKPPARCYQSASLHRAVKYAHVPQTQESLRRCLAEGFPFVFGFSVFGDFESPSVAASGVASMPSAQESPLGGHAAMAVGYDDKARRFLVRNSWGANWGMGGHFTIPYEYLVNAGLSRDFWTIRVVR